MTYDGFGNQQELTVDPAGNVLFLNVSTTVTLVSDADGDGNADAGDVLRFVTLVTNHRGVDLTNVSLTVDLADALRRMPGTVRIYEDASSSTYVEHDVPFSRATVFRNGSWFIDDNQNGYYDVTDATAYFGAPGDLPVLGDWNGDGVDEIGVFRNGTWFLDVTGDGVYGEGDATITFGQAGDLPVVGEWDGTGHDRIGVFRNGYWYLDSNGSGAYDAGDATLVFGTTGDHPVVGDWAGVDQPRIGVYRNGTWYLDSNGSGTYNAGDATLFFGGTPGDLPVIGDWNSDGTDDIAVYSAGQFYYDSDGSGTYNAGDQTTLYGQSGDIAVAGTPPIRPYIIQNMAAGQTARIEYEARIHPAVPSGTLTTRTLISGTAGTTTFTQPAWEDKVTVGSPPPTQQETPDYIGRYGYTGREWEAEINLQFNRGRYYDPATGRWISQDPLGFDAGDSNLYRYVHNRPTGATDPSGLQSWGQVGGEVSGAAAGVGVNPSWGKASSGYREFVGPPAPPPSDPNGWQERLYSLLHGPKATRVGSEAAKARKRLQIMNSDKSAPVLTEGPPNAPSTGANRFVGPPAPPNPWDKNANEAKGSRSDIPLEEWLVRTSVEVRYYLHLKKTRPQSFDDAAANAIRAQFLGQQQPEWSSDPRQAQADRMMFFALDLVDPFVYLFADAGNLDPDPRNRRSFLGKLDAEFPGSAGLVVGERLLNVTLALAREATYFVAGEGLIRSLGALGGLLRRGARVAPANAQNFNRVTTPWQRQVYQRADIDWDFVRPEGTALAGQTNRAAAQQGFTPVRINPATGKVDDIVLHHVLDDPRGAVIETWRSSHTRFHNTIGRGPNDFNEFVGQTQPWRELRPDWAQAWQREQSGYWRWRIGAHNPPTQPRLRLPGDPE